MILTAFLIKQAQKFNYPGNVLTEKVKFDSCIGITRLILKAQKSTKNRNISLETKKKESGEQLCNINPFR